MLIAGPRVFICDRCVNLADEVVAERGRRTNELALLVALDLGNPNLDCSFCNKTRDQTDAMVHAPQRPAIGKHRKRDPGARICVDCLDLCHEILAEQLGGSRV